MTKSKPEGRNYEVVIAYLNIKHSVALSLVSFHNCKTSQMTSKGSIFDCATASSQTNMRELSPARQLAPIMSVTHLQFPGLLLLLLLESMDFQ